MTRAKGKAQAERSYMLDLCQRHLTKWNVDRLFPYQGEDLDARPRCGLTGCNEPSVGQVRQFSVA